MKRDRSQAVVVREDKILLVKHLMDGKEFYCLPGGGIDEGETPEVSAIRELKEEAGVDGTVERLLSVQYKPDNAGNVYSYLCNIAEDAIAVPGTDPEFSPQEQTIIGVAWLHLEEIGMVDQAYLWAAGLNRIPSFHSMLKKMDNTVPVIE